MKICPGCGQPQSSEGVSFCRNCGTALNSVPDADTVATVYSGAPASAPAPTPVYAETATPASAPNPGNKLFFSPDEQLVYVMGDQRYAQYVYSGEIKKDSFVAISSKRVYFRGDSRLIVGGRYRGRKVKANNTVDLCDVTGVESRFSRNPMLLFLAIVFAGLFIILFNIDLASDRGEGLKIVGSFFLIIGIVMLLAYFVTMTKIIMIEYAGGCMFFDSKYYSNSQIEAFQRELFQAKERALIERKNLGTSIY